MTQKCQIIRIAQKQKKMTDVSSKKIRNFRNIKHQVEENLTRARARGCDEKRKDVHTF